MDFRPVVFVRTPRRSWCFASRRFYRLAIETTQTLLPGEIRFPRPDANPLRTVARRMTVAVALILAIAVIVYLGRVGYRDSADGHVTLLDALYYATVSVTTTGYGDVVPVTNTARTVTILVVTPIRVAFLILVVSATVEALAVTSRHRLRVQRWKDAMRDHYVICGFGTKGRSSAATLMSQGVSADRIVVVDFSPKAIEAANKLGYTAVVGDCTQEEILRDAHVDRAKGVVVAVDRDDTATLASLTIRLLNSGTRLVAAVKEEENSKILRSSGASVVITSDEATGRLLGLAIDSPYQAELIEDLLLVGKGVDLVERKVAPENVGEDPPDGTVAVIRRGRIVPAPDGLEEGDRLLLVQRIREGDAAAGD